MENVLVAKVVTTHGIKGDLKLYPLTDFAKIRFKKGKTFELYNEETNHTLNVTCFSFKTNISLSFVLICFFFRTLKHISFPQEAN